MPVTIAERFNIEIHLTEYPSANINYRAWGSEDEDDIYDALVALPVPLTFRTIPLKGFKLEHLGAGIWDCQAVYQFERGTDTDGAYTFDTTGGTSKITQSKQTIATYSAIGGVPNFGGAIGVTKDSVEGTDIVIPTFRWSESYFFDNSVVDAAFKATLFLLTGRTNQAVWRGYNIGEVLFEGVRGQRRGSGKWELNYNLAASPNLTGITVGTMTGIAKKGWEYLWVRHYDLDDTTSISVVRRPLFVVIERVYDPGDLTLLGIGS